MALADLLSLPAPLPDYAAQANASIAQAQQQAQSHPSKLRNFLGALGDAFSVGSGGQPSYRNKIQAAQLASAVGQYLGDPSSALAQIMQINPEAGIDLYKAIHPASEVPAALKEWDAYQKLPADQQAAFIKFRQALDPQIMSPVTIGAYDTVQGLPGADNLPSVSSPDEAMKLAPGTRFRLPDGRIGTVPGGATASPSRTFPVSAVMDAITQQESGGNGKAVSKQGALGSTQLEPGTAKEMANKVGLPFRSDLLQSNDPAALRYQRALGQAYFLEGYNKTGNLTDALHYYHGGPNRAEWGPKTRAYAQSVLSRLGAM